MPTNGMLLWLRADAGITKGSTNLVSSWGDQSGSGNDAKQSDPAAQPLWVTNSINGRPSLKFNGSSDVLSFNRLTNIRTVFWVIRENSAASALWRFLLGDSTGTDFHAGASHQLYLAGVTSTNILNGSTRIN